MQTLGRTLCQEATTQREIDRFLARIYHEAPNDVFELIVSRCSDENGWGRGVFNASRLANKRLKQVVESCTTRLTNPMTADGPDSLPIPIIQKCRRFEEIRCDSSNLKSLEECPVGLKTLYIGWATHLSDLSPLASCSIMESFELHWYSITDISVVSSMPLLKTFVCSKGQGRSSIKDLSPLSSCHMLKKLDLCGNKELKDLSPLSACTALQNLDISDCPLIICLAPLSALANLRTLNCYRISPHTSLLPLVSCDELQELTCRYITVDLKELRKERPKLKIMDY